MLLRIIESSFMFFCIVVFVTQIMLPLFKGLPMFPILRRERRMLDALDEERQKTREYKIAKEIKKEKGKRRHGI